MIGKYYLITYELKNDNGQWEKLNKIIDLKPLYWLTTNELRNEVVLLNYIEVEYGDYINYRNKVKYRNESARKYNDSMNGRL